MDGPGVAPARMLCPGEEAMIQVDALTRRFGDTVALDNVSFSVNRGEIVGFLGPNGAGKTTAMRILTCSLAPTAGTARIAGYDVTLESLAVRRRIGFMPENVPLYPDNSVHSFLRFVARLKGVAGREVQQHLGAIEERTGLTEVRHKLVGHLSRGYRQRVGLAQALVGDPDILVLDEPAAGLDPQQNVEIRELVRSFRGKKSVLLSSHILNEVSLICQRVLILDRGRLVAEESPEILAKRAEDLPCVALAWEGPQEEVRRALAQLPGVAEVIATDSGADVTLSGDPVVVRPRLADAVQSGGGRLQSLTTRSVTLEDLFLRLTGGRQEGGV